VDTGNEVQPTSAIWWTRSNGHSCRPFGGRGQIHPECAGDGFGSGRVRCCPYRQNAHLV